MIAFAAVSAVNTTLYVETGTTAVLDCPLHTQEPYPAWRGPPALNNGNGNTIYTIQGEPTFNPALTNLDRISWAANSKSLVLNNLKREDEGTYTCAFYFIGTSSFWIIKLNPTSKRNNIILLII